MIRNRNTFDSSAELGDDFVVSPDVVERPADGNSDDGGGAAIRPAAL